MRQLAEIVRMCFAPVEDAMFRAAHDLCAEADIVIGHYFVHPLQVAAEQAGIPCVSVLLSHAGVPSEFAHPLGHSLFGKPGMRLLWWLTRAAMNRTLRHYPNRLRRSLGLAEIDDLITQVWIRQPLTLLAVSPQICRPQPDWPAAVRACGFLDMPNIALEGSLPPALSSFLAAGEAPVYMTLGSWMPADLPGQRATLDLLTRAAGMAGCRAIIQSPDPQACGVASSDRVLYLSAAPHQAIFPQCCAVLHHGGAGTTQSAMLAGKPSIVISHISEQEHWGRELQRMGLAGKLLKRRSVTAELIARRIREVRGAAAFGGRAHAVAAAMRQENGVATAVALIEQVFAHRRPVLAA